MARSLKRVAATVEIDLLRLMRAVHLTAEPTGLGDTFWVSGGERQHFVNYREESCDCEDFQCRGGLCKHLLCAGLHMGEPVILRRLRFIVPNPDKARKRVRSLAA